MMCLHPVAMDVKVKGSTFTIERRCGQCETCGLQRAAVWSARIQLEARMHPASVFVTLTYDDDHLPSPPSVSKSDLQKFFKRLRWRYGKLRYFAVGEYGDRSNRPHYHAIIFGMALSSDSEGAVAAAWSESGTPIGFVQVAEFNAARASYIAQYTTKKLRSCAPVAGSLLPEFAVMSRRPGIGTSFVQALSASLVATSVKQIRRAFTDAVYQSHPLVEAYSGSLRLEGRHYPIGSFLLKKVRDFVEGSTPIGDTELTAALATLRKKWNEDVISREVARYDARVRSRRLLARARGVI